MSTPSREKAPVEDPLERLPLRERKKLRTRRAIQDHALRLFAEQGYDATTVEQIAAAAEVSPSTFFRYFPTKEDLIVTDEYDPIMIEAFRSQPPGLTPLAALRAALREIFPYIYEADADTLVARIKIINEVPAVRARVLESMSTGTLAVLVELSAERTGRAPDDPRVQAFAWAASGVLASAMFTWMDSGGTADLVELVDGNLAFLGEGCPLPPRPS